MPRLYWKGEYVPVEILSEITQEDLDEMEETGELVGDPQDYGPYAQIRLPDGTEITVYSHDLEE